MINSKLGVRVAFKIFRRPLFQIRKKNDMELLCKAKQIAFPFENEIVRIYEFGTGSTPILLIHGWRGHAGNFSQIIESLDHAKYNIIAFDAPAHNASTGRTTDFFEITKLAKMIITKYQPRYIVAHSMGSGVAVTALSGMNNESVLKLILLSVPDNLSYLVSAFSKGFGLSPLQKSQFLNFIQERFNKTFEISRISNVIASLAIPILLVHDKHDKVLSFKGATDVATAYNSKIKFVSIDKIGHYKMLSHDYTIEKLKEFIDGKNI